MIRKRLILLVLAAVLLAGCTGGPTGTATPTENSTDTVSAAGVPGVTDGTLTNATALALANERTLTETGGAVQVTESNIDGESDFRLEIGTDFGSYLLSGSRTQSDGQSTDVTLWSNETTRIVRVQTGETTDYRTTDRQRDRLSTLDSAQRVLETGEFRVEETTDDGTVVLTANAVDPSADTPGNVAAFDGRLAVAETGLIHNLTVSATVEGESISYRYELLRTGIDRVERPDELTDLPDGVGLQPELSVDVENGSYLVVRNTGGDSVPANATLALTSDDTTQRVTFETALADGDTRYAYVDTESRLRLSADRPASAAVDPLTSPVSVTIRTDDGATLHSGGMAWESSSASAPETDSGGSASGAATGSASGAAGDSASSGSAQSGASATETA